MRRGERGYGSWAVVTGASSGIGRAFATNLAEAGVNVILVARNIAALESLAATISRETAAETLVLEADLATEEGIRTVREATESFDVGTVVLAAGFGTSGPFLQADLTCEREMLDVNCWATVALTRTFAERFAKRGRGGIVLFSSLVGWQGTPFAAHYAATKAFVQSFAEALRVELASSGVDVIACAPGPVASGFAAKARMTIARASQPSALPRATLRALGRKDTVVPGALGKFLTLSLALLPRPARVRAMGNIMFGMTQGARRTRVRGDQEPPGTSTL